MDLGSVQSFAAEERAAERRAAALDAAGDVTVRHESGRVTIADGASAIDVGPCGIEGHGDRFTLLAMPLAAGDGSASVHVREEFLLALKVAIEAVLADARKRREQGKKGERR